MHHKEMLVFRQCTEHEDNKDNRTNLDNRTYTLMTGKMG